MGGKATVPGRGRKPKPARTKALSGSKHSNPSAIEFGDTIQDVEPPEWLDDLATTMWRTVAPMLCRQGVLQLTDLHNLEVFCSAYSTFRESEQHVAQNGIVVVGATGGPVKNPALTAKNEAARQMASFGENLGLSPSARARLIGTERKTENEFDEF